MTTGFVPRSKAKLAFIINYDSKYRRGRESGADDA